MDAASETVESTKQCADRSLPPLRLTHLFLYIVVASAYLAMAMSWRWNPSDTINGSVDPRYWHIVSTPPALWNAATTTVVILLVCWTFQRRNVLREPGHWLALYFVWTGIAPAIDSQLFQLVRIISGVGLRDDWSHFWPWAKSVHGIRFLVPAVVCVALACGWRRVANTWPWRIYFAVAGTVLCAGAVPNLPYDWGDKLHTTLPCYDYIYIYFWLWQPRVLIVALINDLLPSRPRRHWSHWVPSVQSLLATYYTPIPNIVWNLRHPPQTLPWSGFAKNSP